jgi:hypothetical protein
VKHINKRNGVKYINKKCVQCKVSLTRFELLCINKKTRYIYMYKLLGLQNKSRLTIQGKRVQLGNAIHPYHEIYKTKGVVSAYEAMGILTSQTNSNTLEFIKKESIAMFDKISHGEVYIITNPAWKGWVKIGMAVESKDRLKAYQTSSPLRDYKLRYSKAFLNRRDAETKAHALCSEHAEQVENEWFKMTIKKAIQLIKNINEEQYEKETA